jgi:hypothetical protein
MGYHAPYFGNTGTLPDEYWEGSCRSAWQTLAGSAGVSYSKTSPIVYFKRKIILARKLYSSFEAQELSASHFRRRKYRSNEH